MDLLTMFGCTGPVVVCRLCCICKGLPPIAVCQGFSLQWLHCRKMSLEHGPELGAQSLVSCGIFRSGVKTCGSQTARDFTIRNPQKCYFC